MTPRPAGLVAAVILLAACGAPSGVGTATSPAARAATVSSPVPSKEPAAGGISTATAEIDLVNATGMGGAFNPPNLTVRAGSTVVFVNKSGNLHNVTLPATSEQSPVLFTGDRWSHTFPKPGTFRLVCTYHAGMEGAISVT